MSQIELQTLHLHGGLVESPAADVTHRRRNAQHGQHSEEKAEGADRVAVDKARVFAVERAVGFGTAEADEEQSLGESVGCSRKDRAVQSNDVNGEDTEQQETYVFDGRKNQQALEAALREHQAERRGRT